MRPLIEILEDERTQLMKLESIYRAINKVEDEDILELLIGQRKRHMGILDDIHQELKKYLVELMG